MSDSTPIFFDFSFIISSNVIFDVKYYKLGDLFRTSISKIPEYQNLAVQIEESTNGDYFEIYGTYGNSNENLDDFVEELKAKGQQIKIEYIVSLYEENILQGTQTFTISENFAQKINYRPIIMFSNTTAAISVEMKVTDLVNMSSFSRLASLGLTKNIFKYGRNLTRIELSNAYKPKLYNTKPSTVTMQGGLNASAVIDITKVNYPLLIDKFKVLVGPNNSTSSESTEISGDISQYKSTGLLQIILTPFDNIIKFQIAKEITIDNTIEPLNLADLLLNAELTIIFKSDDQFIERGIFKESGDNDLSNGTVIFKITESDIITIKSIQKNNNNFFLTIKAKNTNVRTQLYSGKFLLFENLKFQDSASNKITVPTVDVTENLSMTPSINEDSLYANVQTDDYSSQVVYDPSSYKNVIVFLKITSDPLLFESFLESKGLKNNVYIKYNYSYFILAVPKAIITEIQNDTLVEKVIEMAFELGKNKVPAQSERERRIYEIENQIRNDATQLATLTKTAEKDNITLQEAIHMAAVWQYDFDKAKQSASSTYTSNENDLQIKLNTAIEKINELENELVLTKPTELIGPPVPPKTTKYVKIITEQRANTTYSTSSKYIGSKLKLNYLYEILQTKRIGTNLIEPTQSGTWYQINTKEHASGTLLGWVFEENIEIIEA